MQSNNTQNKKRYAIYTCTYKDMQTEQPSLEDQRLRCESYTQEHDWEIIPTRYEDQDASQAYTERPGLQNLLGDIRAGKIDGVVVDKLGCLSGSLQEFMHIAGIFTEHDIALTAVTDKLDTETSAGQVAMGMLKLFALYEQEDERMESSK